MPATMTDTAKLEAYSADLDRLEAWHGQDPMRRLAMFLEASGISKSIREERRRYPQEARKLAARADAIAAAIWLNLGADLVQLLGPIA